MQPKAHAALHPDKRGGAPAASSASRPSLRLRVSAPAHLLRALPLQRSDGGGPGPAFRLPAVALCCLVIRNCPFLPDTDLLKRWGHLFHRMSHLLVLVVP